MIIRFNHFSSIVQVAVSLVQLNVGVGRLQRRVADSGLEQRRVAHVAEAAAQQVQLPAD